MSPIRASNLNAYLHESLDGMKITQAFTREEENAKIYNKLNTKMYKSWMKAQYTSNLVWFSVNNISTWVVGAMYLVGFSLWVPPCKSVRSSPFPRMRGASGSRFCSFPTSTIRSSTPWRIWSVSSR